MKRQIMLLVVLVLLNVWAYRSFVNHRPKIQDQIKSRVVKIQVFYPGIGSAQGSGTKIGSNLIITNAHLFLTREEVEAIKRARAQQNHKQWAAVFEFDTTKPISKTPKPKFVFVTESNTATYQAVLVSSDTKRDIAFLRFPHIDRTPRIRLATKWYYHEDLVLNGNPIEKDFKEGSTDILSLSFGYNPMMYARWLFVYPCNEQAPGFSGSGVYNQNGEMMGIAELGESDNNLLQEILINAHLLKDHVHQCMAIPYFDFAKDIQDAYKKEIK